MPDSVIVLLLAVVVITIVSVVVIVIVGSRRNSWREEFEALAHAQREQNEQLSTAVDKWMIRARELEEVTRVAIGYIQLLIADMIVAGLEETRPIPKSLERWMNGGRDKIETQHTRRIARGIAMYFDEEEFNGLLFDLGVEADVGGESLRARARELVRHYSNRGEMGVLVGKLEEERPNVPWKSL